MNKIISNPFRNIDGDGPFEPALNISTQCQRELGERILGTGRLYPSVCMVAESGLGRSHTLGWAEHVIRNSRHVDGERRVIRHTESYATMQSIFGEGFPDMDRASIEGALMKDGLRVFVLVDYPYRYVKGDLDASVRAILELTDMQRVSIIMTLTPSQLASVDGKETLMDRFDVIRVPSMRKEEVSMLIRKRLDNANDDVPRGRVERESDYLHSFHFPPIIFPGEAIEFIHAISGGSPRLALIAASTLFDKARQNGCVAIDGELIELVSSQAGYLVDGRGCVLRSGLSTLLRTILERFSISPGADESEEANVRASESESLDTRNGAGVLEHRILTYMYDRFGWDFNVTRLRLRTLVRMKLLMEELVPTNGWFKHYTVRG